MNLFVLDNDFDKCAEYHVDRHVGKMLLEATQLLCTTFHINGVTAPYKPSHNNHPCAVFTRESKENFDWVIQYAFALAKEFIYRYDKVHKSSEVLGWCMKNKHLLTFPKQSLTPFALAMPDQYKTNDPVESYRNYYFFGKGHLAAWKGRAIPFWYNDKYFI